MKKNWPRRTPTEASDEAAYCPQLPTPNRMFSLMLSSARRNSNNRPVFVVSLPAAVDASGNSAPINPPWLSGAKRYSHTEKIEPLAVQPQKGHPRGHVADPGGAAEGEDDNQRGQDEKSPQGQAGPGPGLHALAVGQPGGRHERGHGGEYRVDDVEEGQLDVEIGKIGVVVGRVAPQKHIAEQAEAVAQEHAHHE